MPRFALHLLMIAIAHCAATANAATWYVDNVAGGDHLGGRMAIPSGGEGPFQTIEAALASANRGDRIEIAPTPVPYREMISLSGPRHQGYPDQPLTINGNGAVLDGTVTAEAGAWKPVGGDVFALRPRRLTYQQLFAAGQPLKRMQAGGRLEEVGGADATIPLEPMQWALVGDRITFRVEPGKLPADSSLRHCGLQTGITLYNVQHVRIENLVVQGFHTDGISAPDLVRDCVIEGVECRANGRSGLSVGGASRVDVTRSNFYDNGRVQVRSEGQGRLSLQASDVDDSTAPKFQTSGGFLTVDKQPITAP